MNKLSVLPMTLKEDFKAKDMFSKSKPVERDEFAGALEKMKSKIDKKQKSKSGQNEESQSLKASRREKEDAVVDSAEKNEEGKAVKAENENTIKDSLQPANEESVELAGIENILIDKSIIKDLKELNVKEDDPELKAAVVSDSKSSEPGTLEPANEMKISREHDLIEACPAIDDETTQAPVAKESSEASGQNLQNTEDETIAQQDAITAVIPDNARLKDKDSQKKEVMDKADSNGILHEKPENILGQSIKKLLAERNAAGKQFPGEDLKDTLDSIKEEITKLSEESEELKFPGFSSDISAGRISQELMRTKPVYYSQREVVDQIINKMKIIDADNLKAIEIKLEPEQLGKVTLKVVMENGILTAKLVAESEKVKAALESNMAHLKDSMLEQGINIAAVDVSVGSGTQNGKGYEDGFGAAVRSKRISSAVFNDALEDATGHGGAETNNPYMLDEEINYLA